MPDDMSVPEAVPMTAALAMLPAPDPRRWLVLAIGMLAMVAACALQYGLPYLIPALMRDGLSLSEAGFVVSAPVGGVMLALVLWGMAADRYGERGVLAVGLAGAAVALVAAAQADSTRALVVWLVAGGASSAAAHAASGRLILGWFSPHERGVAMGARQMAQPLGVALAAVTVPRLSADGTSGAMLALAAGLALAATLTVLGVRDPERGAISPAASRSPYGDGYLRRLHTTGMLLVVPQFVVGAFAFDYLVRSQGWSLAAAGALLAALQLGGAAARLGLGWWSDRAQSRLRPLRQIALATGVVMVALAVGAVTSSVVAVVALSLSAVLSASPNGLTFTAVAERAGMRWAGRALGVHNTGQNAVATLTAPAAAALLTLLGAGGGTGAGHGSAYAVTFAVAAVMPFVAAMLIPVSRERLGAVTPPKAP